MNRNMDRKIYQAPSCDTLNTTTQDVQCNLEMFTPILKQEIVQCFDGEENNCNNHMCEYGKIQSLNCVNYYDSQFCVLKQVKKEFPEDEYPQSATSASHISKCNNKELSQVLETQGIKQENSKEALSFIKKEAIHDEKNQFMVKTEISKEHQILDNAGDKSILYEILITPPKVQPKMCGGILKNRFNLSIHNKDHIKVEVPTSENNERNELHKCQCCEEYFHNHDTMLAHMNDIHSKKKPKSVLYHKAIKPYPTGRNGKEVTHKCELCERVYKRRGALVTHIKKIHYDYGKIFECWCGKQFRSPINLYYHKYKRHGVTIKAKKNVKLQCDYCLKFYNTKETLVNHITSIHYDYGKTFVCWCGKQFRTPIHLSRHKNRQHGAKVKSTNKAAFKTEFQCDMCKRIFKSKMGLINHITSIHYSHKTFKCWCGKQFHTPMYLYQHKYKNHGFRMKSTKNVKFQCDSCHKNFKTKDSLINHIKSNHYEYGKTFG